MSTAEQGGRVSRSGSGFAYLAVLLVGDVVAQVVNYIVPEDADSGALSPALVLSIGIVLASAVLWWRYPCRISPSASLRLFLGAVMGLWLVAFIVAASRGESASIRLFILLFLLAALWLKPPTEDAAVRATVALGWTIVGATVLAVVLQATGVVPSWYERYDLQELAEGDRTFYWLPLAEVLGIDARWAGPFVHPNLAGPLGAALLVFGLTRSGVTRVAFSVTGAGILLLTGSRNSLVAGAAGVLVVVIAWWLLRPGRLPRWLRVILAAVPVVAMLAVLYLRDSGFSGRTTVWPEYVRLWADGPVFGVGQEGIDRLIDAGVLPGWAHHAHNVALDTLVRYGIVGLAVMLVAFGAGLVIVWSAARAGRVAGLALLVMLIVGGMADTILRWSYLTTPMALLLLAVLISTGLGRRQPTIDDVLFDEREPIVDGTHPAP